MRSRHTNAGAEARVVVGILVAELEAEDLLIEGLGSLEVVEVELGSQETRARVPHRYEPARGTSNGPSAVAGGRSRPSWLTTNARADSGPRV